LDSVSYAVVTFNWNERLRISYKLRFVLVSARITLENEGPSSGVQEYRNRLEHAANYAEVWEIVKDTVEFVFHKRRGSMMLFLDDLPIQLGAYHAIGTNNIVLNRVLIQIVETAVEDKNTVNAFVYNLLVHEYLHALGEVSEVNVRGLVIEVCKKAFGEDYVATQMAMKSPWAVLKGIPLDAVNVPKRVMEIVKDFEKSDRYIV
jgi:hypothetical protein